MCIKRSVVMLKKFFFLFFIQSFVLVLIQHWEQGPNFQLHAGQTISGCPQAPAPLPWADRALWQMEEDSPNRT